MSGSRNGKTHSQHTWSSFLKGKYLFWWLPVDRNWNETLLKPTANLDYWLQIDISFTFLSFFLTQPWFVMSNPGMLQPFLDKVDTFHGQKGFCKWSYSHCDQSAEGLFSARIKNKLCSFKMAKWTRVKFRCSARCHAAMLSSLVPLERGLYSRQVSMVWSAVRSGSPHSHTAPFARSQFFMDDLKHPTPARGRSIAGEEDLLLPGHPPGPRWSGGYAWARTTPTPAARMLPASCLLIGPHGWNRACLVPPCCGGGAGLESARERSCCCCIVQGMPVMFLGFPC